MASKSCWEEVLMEQISLLSLWLYMSYFLKRRPKWSWKESQVDRREWRGLVSGWRSGLMYWKILHW